MSGFADVPADRIEYTHSYEDGSYSYQIFIDEVRVLKGRLYGNQDQRDVDARKAFNDALRKAGKLIGG